MNWVIQMLRLDTMDRVWDMLILVDCRYVISCGLPLLMGCRGGHGEGLAAGVGERVSKRHKSDEMEVGS